MTALRLLKFLLALTLLCNSLVASAQNSEANIKAAFILNFAKFVEWPENHPLISQGSFNFCFIGSDRFKKEIQSKIGDRQVKGLSTQITMLGFTEPLDDCAVVFMRDLEPSQSDYVMKSLRASNTLTIGETDKFMRSGGMIRFYADQNRIRFEINPTAAQKAGLKISSQLLNLAKIAPTKIELEK